MVVSGMGKSGHIGKKIAASLASTGTPAFFVHPAKALHGDLGMIESRDILLFISYSGTAKELDLIIPRLQEKAISLIAITGKSESPLAKAALAILELSRTGLGLVAVCRQDNLVTGVFTDGDLCRWLVGGGKLEASINTAMTRSGIVLNAESRAIDAKEILMKKRISAAPVVDGGGKLVGAINLHDFHQAGIL